MYSCSVCSKSTTVPLTSRRQQVLHRPRASIRCSRLQTSQMPRFLAIGDLRVFQVPVILDADLGFVASGAAPGSPATLVADADEAAAQVGDEDGLDGHASPPAHVTGSSVSKSHAVPPQFHGFPAALSGQMLVLMIQPSRLRFR